MAAAASALRLLLEPWLDGQAPLHLALLATAWAAARGGFGPVLLAGSAGLAANSRAERAQSEEEAHARVILDLSPQVLWTARPDGGMEDFARRWLAGLDRPDARAGARRWLALADGWACVAHPDDLPLTTGPWRRSVEAGEPCDVEHRVRMADGSFRGMRSRAVPRRDPATGEVLRWYGTTEDVHDRHGAEAAPAPRTPSGRGSWRGGRGPYR